jgi:hypothetical protein
MREPALVSRDLEAAFPAGPFAPATPVAYALYVVDDALNVLLEGTEPADLAPAEASRCRLPIALRPATRDVIALHNFAAIPVAAARAGTHEIRIAKRSGPAGDFYAVMVQTPKN